MRFKAPYVPSDVPDSPPGDIRRERLHYPLRPAWLKQWLEDKGKWVKLECGHKENINDRSALVILQKTFGKKNIHVYCETHNAFFAVERALTFNEYRGVAAKPIPDEPEF